MSFNLLKMGEGKLALSVHPPEGSAIYSSRFITRENHRAEITEAETENAISQAIWQLFDEERMLFSKRLDLSEMDVVMADVRVLYIKLDGCEVVNPIGFTAKTIEIGLAEILITREMSEEIKISIPKKNEIIFTLEPTASCAWLIQKDSKKKDFIVARISDKKTFVYRSSVSGGISYISDFDWGINKVFSTISDYFGVSAMTGKDIIHRYAREDMSREMQKGLKEIISSAFADFSRGVTIAARNAKITKPTLYVLSDDLQEMNPTNVSWKDVGVKMNFLPAIHYEELVANEMAGSDPQSSWNRLAKRRMKWLMCHK
jgi:hypothetical protein